MQDTLKTYRHIIICDEASPAHGGIQNMAYWIASTLADRGYSVVMAGYQDELCKEALAAARVECHTTDAPTRSRKNSDLKLMALLLKLRTRYGSRVIVYSLLINRVKVFRWLQFMLGWQCVSFLHGNEVLRFLKRRPATLLRNILACQCVFANSRYTLGLVQGLAGEGHLHLLSPGIPAHLYQTLPDQDYRSVHGWQNRKIILMLGRLVKRKGHGIVMEAVARLRAKHPDVMLVIGGTGPYLDTLKMQAAEQGIADVTHFMGFVAEADKPALFQACDIFCMLSDMDEEIFEVEGFGIVLLEAAAMGKLAIAADCGGMNDAVEQGRSGFLISPGDTSGLTTLLDTILTHPDVYQTLRDYARNRALSQFDWGSRVDQMLDTLARRITQ